MLEAQGNPIDRRTLGKWRDHVHPDRYAHIKAQVDETLAQQREQLAYRYGQLAHRIAAKLEAEYHQLKPGELPGALRNVEVSAGVALDKAMGLRGKPTSIVEHRSTPAESVKALGRLAPGLIYEGTATELPAHEPEQGNQQPALPAPRGQTQKQRASSSQ